MLEKTVFSNNDPGIIGMRKEEGEAGMWVEKGRKRDGWRNG